MDPPPPARQLGALLAAASASIWASTASSTAHSASSIARTRSRCRTPLKLRPAGSQASKVATSTSPRYVARTRPSARRARRRVPCSRPLGTAAPRAVPPAAGSGARGDRRRATHRRATRRQCGTRRRVPASTLSSTCSSRQPPDHPFCVSDASLRRRVHPSSQGRLEAPDRVTRDAREAGVGVEYRSPEAGAQVRILPGALRDAPGTRRPRGEAERARRRRDRPAVTPGVTTPRPAPGSRRR